MKGLEINSVRYPASLDITIVDLGRRGIQVALTDGGSVYRRRRWQTATLAAIDCMQLVEAGHRPAAPRAVTDLNDEAWCEIQIAHDAMATQGMTVPGYSARNTAPLPGD